MKSLLGKFQNLTVDSGQNHPVDISRAFGQFHDLLKCIEHELIRKAFQLLVRLNHFGLDYHQDHRQVPNPISYRAPYY